MKKIFLVCALCFLSIDIYANNKQYGHNGASLISSQDENELFSGQRFNVWGELGYTGGDVTYQIGGHVVDNTGTYDIYFPISELRWPITVPVATIGADLSLTDNLLIYGTFLTNLQRFSGKMKDLDWEYQYWSVSTYSESNSNINQFNTDIGIEYWINDKNRPNANSTVIDFQHPTYGIGAGLMFQDYKWEASDAEQWNPLFEQYGYYFPHIILPGPVGTYKAAIQFYYAELIARVKNDILLFEASFGYSPLAIVDDEDDHLLRGKRSKGHTTGYGFKMNLNGRYDISRTFFLTASGYYLYIQTQGTSNNLVYAQLDPYLTVGEQWAIDEKVVSGQWKVSLGAGVRF
jgi:hypothetical protein